MARKPTRSKLIAALCAALALALAGPSAAMAADEQQPLPANQVYDYNCGRLGSDCGGEDESQRRKLRRARKGCARKDARAGRRAARRTGRRGNCTTRRATRREGSGRR